MTKTIRRLMKYLHPYLPLLLLSFVLTLFAVVLTLSVPILIGNAVDSAVGPGQVDFKKLSGFVIEIIVVSVGASFFRWISTSIASSASSRCVRDIRSSAFCRIGELPVSYIDKTPHGDILNRTVSDPDNIADGLLGSMIQLFDAVTTVAGTIIIMLTQNVIMGLLVTVLTPLSLLASSCVAKGSYRYFSKQTEIQSEITGYSGEIFAVQKLVNSAGAQKYTQDEFDKINSRLYHCGFRAQFFSALVNPSTRFVNNMIYALCAIVGALMCISGKLASVGLLSMFLTYASQYAKPFNSISGIIAQLQASLASAEHVMDMIDLSPEDDISDHDFHESDRSVIEFDNISFSYDKAKELIRDFSLKIEPGCHVAIVGATGSGKTTLINLLMRFYDVDSGRILLDNNNIKEISRKDLRSGFGMVLQDTWIFKGTVYENIAFGNPEAAPEKVEYAARKCHAHSFIRRLPQGYNTVIGNDTGSLSQGQKQLICIARAILKNPDVLILDEATSDIDTLTERYVKDAFSEITKGKTSFIVAHRLSTVKDADIILVMDHGKVAEQGTHDELYAKNGIYRKLYTALSV